MKNDEQGAAFWIAQLKLTPHPEGGYFREEYRSNKIVAPKETNVERSAMTSIYYLLEKDDYSAFHRIKSPESWFFHKGAPLLLYYFKDNKLLCSELSDQENGVLQITMEPGTWFAARLKQPENYTLVSCVVAPGFEYQEFELAHRDALLAQYPNYKEEILALTR